MTTSLGHAILENSNLQLSSLISNMTHSQLTLRYHINQLTSTDLLHLIGEFLGWYRLLNNPKFPIKIPGVYIDPNKTFAKTYYEENIYHHHVILYSMHYPPSYTEKPVWLRAARPRTLPLLIPNDYLYSEWLQFQYWLKCRPDSFLLDRVIY